MYALFLGSLCSDFNVTLVVLPYELRFCCFMPPLGDVWFISGISMGKKSLPMQLRKWLVTDECEGSHQHETFTIMGFLLHCNSLKSIALI